LIGLIRVRVGDTFPGVWDRRSVARPVREGKIFIDYLRDVESAGAIAPYSTGACEGAPLALPIDWKELTKLVGASDFHIREALHHLKEPGPTC
jgi:DNA primase